MQHIRAIHPLNTTRKAISPPFCHKKDHCRPTKRSINSKINLVLQLPVMLLAILKDLNPIQIFLHFEMIINALLVQPRVAHVGEPESRIFSLCRVIITSSETFSLPYLGLYVQHSSCIAFQHHLRLFSAPSLLAVASVASFKT